MTNRRRAAPAFSILAFSALAALAGCDGPVSPEGENASLSPAAPVEAAAAVAVPFEARFFTDGKGVTEVVSECGTAPILLNTQDGAGQATHLGQFSTVLTFCMDMTAAADGIIEEGESLPYDNGGGSFITVNGDALHIEISGVVVPSDHPDFDLEFQDTFYFVGGTGRFEGATGEGITESYVDRSTGRTHHLWEGVLVLKPGVSRR